MSRILGRFGAPPRGPPSSLDSEWMAAGRGYKDDGEGEDGQMRDYSYSGAAVAPSPPSHLQHRGAFDNLLGDLDGPVIPIAPQSAMDDLLGDASTSAPPYPVSRLPAPSAMKDKPNRGATGLGVPNGQPRSVSAGWSLPPPPPNQPLGRSLNAPGASLLDFGDLDAGAPLSATAAPLLVAKARSLPPTRVYTAPAVASRPPISAGPLSNADLSFFEN
jgi:hypothetical protein